jgi:aryl-alcohol dehydrogenase-like predicted oxidoreductase
MKKKLLGKSKVEISEIVLGCWAMGGEFWGGTDDEKSINAIRAAFDLGITTLDTAEAYNKGYSERVIAQALKGIKNDVVISSKVASSHLAYDQVIEACERSLVNLNRDYIDIYFLHWPSREGVPLEETMKAMDKLKKDGKIKCIGLSNFGKDSFELAKSITEVDAYQPPYNLLWRGIDKEMLPYCIENDIGVMPYSPIAQGLLTGKFSLGHQFPEGDTRGRTPLFQPENMKRALILVEQLKPFAEKYDKTLAQLSMRWVMQVSGITAPIVGGRNAKQVKENVGAVGWAIEDSDFEKIDELSREFCDALPNYASYFNKTIVK